MNEYILNGAEITDRKTLHTALAQTLDFPEYYGANLDALMDCLTDICQDTCLIITDCTAMEESLGTYYHSLLRVLRGAHRENPCFSYELRSVI